MAAPHMHPLPGATGTYPMDYGRYVRPNQRKIRMQRRRVQRFPVL